VESGLANQVWSVANRPEVVRAVHELYARVQVEIDARRPNCVMSGRCCKFEEYGHLMYITTLELGVFAHEFGRQFGSGEARRKFLPWNGTGCPFQVGKMCGVHAFRPFGCRIFFCDPTSTAWQHEQYERFHEKLKELHGTFDVPYAYIEWRGALQRVFGDWLAASVGGDGRSVGLSI
jgi:Fe-S-cluster containining protein